MIPQGYSIGLIICIILGALFRRLNKPADWKDIRKAKEQLTVRTVMNANSYVTYSLIAAIASTIYAGKIIIFLAIVVEVYIVMVRIKSFKNLYQIPIDQINSQSIIMVLIKTFFGFLFTASIINALLYYSIPGFYGGCEGHGFVEICVEILHYTFGLMITYSSGDSIIAVHPVARIVEMIEIMFFYVIFGFVGMNLANEALSKRREKL